MSEKFNICFVSPSIYPYFQNRGFGGAELQIVLLSKMLVGAGHRVTIVTNDYGQPDEEWVGEIRIIKIPLRFFGGSNFYFIQDTLRFIWKMRRMKFDVCFMKTPNTMLFQLGLLKFSTKIIKIFASDEDCYTSNKFPDILYNIGLKLADFFVFQTTVQQHLAKQNLNVTGKIIKNIFVPTTSPELFVKDIDALWVGGFQPGKQPEKLLEIIEATPECKFTIISKPCPEELRDLEDKLKALPNVEYLGMIPSHRISSYYTRARIFLCTSKTEGFPNTFLQAWYADSPVISLEYPCDGVLQEFEAGIVSGSVEKMSDDILQLLNFDSKRIEMGRNGKKYVQKYHLEQAVLPEYESMLKSLLNKS